LFTRLYLHIPFCLRKCGYCAFNSQQLPDTGLNDYVALLLEEMRLVSSVTTPGQQLDSIYFGGGTPSLLGSGQVARLIENATELFGRGPDCEITLEANPGTVDQALLADFRSAGVNRLSLGVQSFDDSFLDCLGRAHNAYQTRKAFSDARTAGFSNISIDLMHSLPAQNITQWQTDLEQAIRLSPEHISVYGLTVEEGTPFYDRYRCSSSEKPDDDLSADMFEMADDLLSAAGFEHYEIANHARPGCRSRHNSGYWLRDGYRGVGVGAHSLLRNNASGVRLCNLERMEEYAEALLHGELPLFEETRLTEDDAMSEFIFLGLRMADGIEFSAFEREFGQSFFEVYGAAIDELVEAGLLTREHDALRLTRCGMLLSNQVFSRFV